MEVGGSDSQAIIFFHVSRYHHFFAFSYCMNSIVFSFFFALFPPSFSFFGIIPLAIDS